MTVRTTAAVAGAASPSVGNGLFFGLSLSLVTLALACIRFGPKQKTSNWKHAAAALACVLFAVLVFQVGCAGSSANPGGGGGGGSSGTPAGTYTITVTGTYTGTYPFGTLVHSVPTMLTVQ
jgi:hypothetical protein